MHFIHYTETRTYENMQRSKVMKRILSYLVLAAMLLVGFAGCASVKYTVSYSVDGTVSTETVEKGGTATCAEPEAIEGKTFDGWYTDRELTDRYDEQTPVTGNITLYGTWRDSTQLPSTHTVTFVIDGVSHAVTVADGAAAVYEDPSKTGYIFNGWYTDEECTQKYQMSSPVTGDLTLYAGWKEVNIPKNFTVKFDLAGGSANPAIAQQSVKEGGKAKQPENDPYKKGNTFLGWYLDGTVYDFEAPVTKNLTIVAQWSENVPVATATSEAANHGAALAIDGNSETYWQAASAGEASLTLDLARVAEVRSVTQVFATEAEWKFELAGSMDGRNWAPFGTVTAIEAKDEFTVSAGTYAYFRYIRLNVLEGGVASSRALSVNRVDLAEGTNVALGMKGGATSWTAGGETELAFDGNYDTFHCSNDGGFPKFLSVEWTYNVYVDRIELHYPNDGEYSFHVEVREKGSSEFPEIARESAVPFVKGEPIVVEVGRKVDAIVFWLDGASVGWPAISEMNVFGFKDLAANAAPEQAEGYDVYEIGRGYLDRVTTDSPTAEYSADGKSWIPVAMIEGAGEVQDEAAFVRVKADANVEIFATSFNVDLARYTTATADSYTDEGYRPGIATMNPENTWVRERFWCAQGPGEEHWLQVDLGNPCIVESWLYEFQDESDHNNYALRIELSLDGQSWTKVFDNFDALSGGKIFTGKADGVLARYVRATVLITDNWINCKTFQVYGVGAPVRNVDLG